MDNEFKTFFGHYYWIAILGGLVAVTLASIVIWLFLRCRKRPFCEYTALEDEAVLQDRLEMDRKLQRDADRNLALINCQHYLQNSLRYVFIQQLNDLGSRIDKHWFLVRDTATKTDRLLIMMPVSDNCPILCNTTTQQALIELFVAFQHPYIYPILDVDFMFLNQQQFVVLIMPFNDKGSLKDLIYQSNCQQDWREKYQYYGTGLSESQIQQLGRQILEGMIFLREHGFPNFGHLHCGNIIIQNGVARISGLENVLLGNTTRIYFLLQKYICDNQDCIDSISFGHLLFEMAAGYELNTPYPKEKNYRDLNHCPRIIKVLKFIFRQEGIHYPLIQEISRLEFFRHIDLRELRSHSFPANLSISAHKLLRDIRYYQKYHIRTSPFSTHSTNERSSNHGLNIGDRHLDCTQWRTVSPYHKTSDSRTLYVV